MSPVRLTLFSRAYCHLCHDMVAALQVARQTRAFELEVVDVDAHPDLESRFGEWVPVLMRGDQEVFHYFYDEARLDQALAAAPSQDPSASSGKFS